MTKTTDFHFRLAHELRERLRRAVQLIEVQGDRRRKTPTPSMSDLVVAFIELGLERMECGESIVEAPSLVAKSARQWFGDGDVHLAPLLSSEIYAALGEGHRPPSFEEIELLDRDARRVSDGSTMVLRGVLFTDPAGDREGSWNDLVGKAGKVVEVSRKRAMVRFGRRKPAQVHVYDLVPEGLPG